MGKIIGLIIAIAILIGGFIYWNSRQDTALNTQPNTTDVAVVAEAVPAATTGQGAVSSIKEAMGLGKKMQCTYTVGEDVPTQTTVLVDGEKFKSTTTMKDMTVYGMFDGELQYTWTDKEKQGSKMSKDCLDKLAARFQNTAAPDTPEKSTTPLTQDLREGFDGLRGVDCRMTDVVDFSLPEDVSFVDQCAMIEQSMKTINDVKDKLPAGVTLPTAY